MYSILDAIKKFNEETPEKLCIADYNGLSYTYREYWEVINKIASFFKRKGLKKKDSVLIESFQSGIFIAIVFATQLVGGVSVPIEKNTPIEGLLKIKKEINAKFMVCKENREKIDNQFTVVEIFDYIKETPFELLKMNSPEGSTLAEILFTTGTTGKSKGIMISHEANVALGQNISYGVQMKKENIELIPVPINHSYGLRSFYASMYNGSSVVLLDGFASPRNFFFAIEKFKVTSIALVPAILNMIFTISKDYIKKYSEQLDYIQSGSAALSEDVKERLCKFLPKSKLYNFYGSTEAGRCCILEYSKDKEKISCIGKPAYNASFKIIGDDGEIILSSKNNIGRLICKGKMNMLGYWNAQEETKQVMKNGFILTDDLCYIKDGYVYYVGRRDDVINVGGNKISPIEIEEVANIYKDVQESVCISVKDDILGQATKLFIVLNEGIQFNKSSFLKHLSNNLEEFKVPKNIEIIEKIPRMYNGKIDRKSIS